MFVRCFWFDSSTYCKWNLGNSKKEWKKKLCTASYLTWQPVKLQFVMPMTSITLLNWRLHATISSVQCCSMLAVLLSFKHISMSSCKQRQFHRLRATVAMWQTLPSISTHTHMKYDFLVHDHFCWLSSQKRTQKTRTYNYSNQHHYTIYIYVSVSVCVWNTAKHQS